MPETICNPQDQLLLPVSDFGSVNGLRSLFKTFDFSGMLAGTVPAQGWLLVLDSVGDR